MASVCSLRIVPKEWRCLNYLVTFSFRFLIYGTQTLLRLAGAEIVYKSARANLNPGCFVPKSHSSTAPRKVAFHFFSQPQPDESKLISMDIEQLLRMSTDRLSVESFSDVCSIVKIVNNRVVLSRAQEPGPRAESNNRKEGFSITWIWTRSTPMEAL